MSNILGYNGAPLGINGAPITCASAGTDTSDATLSSNAQMLYPYTSYANGIKYTGSIQSQAAQTIYPSTSDQTIASGKYLTGTQTVKGVLLTNLTADNIKKDVVVKVGDSADDDRITSITGTYEGGGGGPVLPDPSTVTDLGGTTWLINSNADYTSLPWAVQGGYCVVVQTCYSNTGSHPFGTIQNLGTDNLIVYIPIVYLYGIGKYNSSTDGIGLGGNNLYIKVDSDENTSRFRSIGTSSWCPVSSIPEGLRVWRFLVNPSGYTTTDNTNANLITWMKNNATLINID